MTLSGLLSGALGIYCIELSIIIYIQLETLNGYRRSLITTASVALVVHRDRPQSSTGALCQFVDAIPSHEFVELVIIRSISFREVTTPGKTIPHYRWQSVLLSWTNPDHDGDRLCHDFNSKLTRPSDLIPYDGLDQKAL
jgi:hypothetical protein